VRAEFGRCAERHGAANAEFTRFVAGGCYDPARVARAADDHGRAAKVWTIEQFDGYEERIHIDMKDGGSERGGWNSAYGRQCVVFCAELSQLGHEAVMEFIARRREFESWTRCRAIQHDCEATAFYGRT
jgi:hypothetical protein